MHRLQGWVIKLNVLLVVVVVVDDDDEDCDDNENKVAAFAYNAGVNTI